MHLKAFSTLATLSFSPRHAPCRAVALDAGASVVVGGAGTISFLAARLAAIEGFATTLIAPATDLETARAVMYDTAHPEGSLPLQYLPLSGPGWDGEALTTAVEAAEGLVLCLDKDWTFTEQQLESFIPGVEAKLQHVSLMSRNLNGEGLGFFSSAAKRGANPDVWEATKESVDNYQQAERVVKARAEAAQATWTIVRAGTLKGGGSGDSGIGGEGEARFLNAQYYERNLGSMWQLLYDVGALGVKLSAGDVLPGPGFTAALTATERVGSGDSHRGAVATALVEAMRVPSAANRDFGVAAVEGKTFPAANQWSDLFSAV